MQVISPRLKAGLSMFDALSELPLVFPALMIA